MTLGQHADPPGDVIDMVGQLREHFGRDTLGTYFSITRGGVVKVGDQLAG